MTQKLKTIEEAAAQIHDGDQVVMSAGLVRPPMAVLRQVIRQGTRGLRAVGVVGGEINLDVLVGAGVAASIDTCSMHLGEFARTAPNFARHVVAGRIQALDNT